MLLLAPLLPMLEGSRKPSDVRLVARGVQNADEAERNPPIVLLGRRNDGERIEGEA